ncbi:TauD/TfdA family dioxygenase [Woeseiaceae bacterium]|jgi:gamma-butyrobetaine dioxygenase|nr:TauD/TfdA family dioxygenase [Woeseiaceae bacterium]
MTLSTEQNEIVITKDSIRIVDNGKVKYDLPHLWLRDNCQCDECRVVESQEKRFMLSSIDSKLMPVNVEYDGEEIQLRWPDNHETIIDLSLIRELGRKRKPDWKTWGVNFKPSYFSWQEFITNDSKAVNAIKEFISSGVIILSDAPREPETLELLSSRLGPLRETLFERIHNVSVSREVYNIAHTSLELPPHNDFASYTWPPSVQGLHMLENECEGGESIVVDGWALLEKLRNDHPKHFQILCEFGVPFREFDENNETYAIEPMIKIDSNNIITGFRFSNQLMQVIDPTRKKVKEFYLAYHELCSRVLSTSFRSVFRLEGGQILLVAAHRVLHARQGFVPEGKRHLQDAYFEMDNIVNNIVVLRRRMASHDG